MAALQYAKDRADKMDMIGVYLRAEELRGKVAGYYIDKQIIAKKDLDDESEEQLENKMKKILDDNKEFTK